jgi:hypothetical protein
MGTGLQSKGNGAAVAAASVGNQRIRHVDDVSKKLAVLATRYSPKTLTETLHHCHEQGDCKQPAGPLLSSLLQCHAACVQPVSSRGLLLQLLLSNPASPVLNNNSGTHRKDTSGDQLVLRLEFQGTTVTRHAIKSSTTVLIFSMCEERFGNKSDTGSLAVS